MSIANAFRTQARLVLPTCTTRPALCVLPKSLLQRVHSPRVFSTSRHLRVDSESATSADPNEARLQRKNLTRSNTLFVAGLPARVTEDQVREVFGHFGDVVRIAMGPKYADCWQAKYAHVQFERVEDAVAAYQSAEEEPITVAGEPLRIDFSQPSGKVQQIRPTARLFFGRDAFPEVIHEIMEPFKADIVGANILRDRSTGEPTGQVFFRFTDVEAATAAYKALQEAGHDMRFRMKYAQPK